MNPGESVSQRACLILKEMGEEELGTLRAQILELDKTKILACSRGIDYYSRMLILDACCPILLFTKSDEKRNLSTEKVHKEPSRAKTREKELCRINNYVHESIRYLHAEAFIYNVMILQQDPQWAIMVDNPLFNARDVELFPIADIRVQLNNLLEGMSFETDYRLPKALIRQLSQAVLEVKDFLQDCKMQTHIPFLNSSPESFNQPLRFLHAGIALDTLPPSRQSITPNHSPKFPAEGFCSFQLANPMFFFLAAALFARFLTLSRQHL
jgi:hypothetical protein